MAQLVLLLPVYNISGAGRIASRGRRGLLCKGRDIPTAQKHACDAIVRIDRQRASQDTSDKRIGTLHHILTGTTHAHAHPVSTLWFWHRGIEPPVHFFQYLQEWALIRLDR